MSNEPKLFLPLELVYGVLDNAQEVFGGPAAAENMAMDFVMDNCKCGQDHTYDEVPDEIKVLARNSVEASLNTVKLIRSSIEAVVIKNLEDS